MNANVAVVFALSAGACAFSAAACSSSHAAGGAALPPAGEAGYALPPVGDDSGDLFADSAPGVASVRIAHVSPDAPALDVCVALHGTTDFRGPLIAQLAASLAGGGSADGGKEDDAGPVGLAFSQVSAYLSLAPGQYDVRLVAAGAQTCASPAAVDDQNESVEGGDDAGEASVVLEAGTGLEGGMGLAGGATPFAPPDSVNLPALQANTFTTLVIAGDLTPAGDDAPLGVSLLTDDDELAGGAASLRAINAVPSLPALDFGLGSGAAWMPMLTDVAFGKASSMSGPGQGTVDANGYVPIPTFVGQAMSACVPSSDAGVDVATAGAVDVELGAIATVMAIGGKSGDSAQPPELLICIDNEPSGGLLSDCSVGQ
jgi:hypothetical protein